MAYGINSPFGLQPRWTLQGGGFTGQLSSYLIAPGYTTPVGTLGIFTGDPVQLLANGTIGVGAPGLPACGVFFGVKYTDASRNFVYSPFWPTGQALLPNTFAQALIVDAPDTLFDVQSSYSGAGIDATTVQLGVKQSDLNKNANFGIGGTFSVNPPPNNPASGSIISGQSGFYLDLSTLSNDAGANLKILRLTPIQNSGSVLIPNSGGNVFYNAPGGIGVGPGNFNNVVVSLNNDSFRGGTGTSVAIGNYVAQGTLMPAQMNAALTGGIILIPAIGAGSMIVINSWSLQTTTATVYVNGGDPLQLQYTDAANTVAAANITTANFVNAADNPGLNNGAAASGPFPGTIFGQGIRLHANSNYTAGVGNNVHWSINYSVVAV